MSKQVLQKNILEGLFKAKGIRAVLFDLDDTLIRTGDMIISKMRGFSEAVSSGGVGRTAEEMYLSLREENDKAYEKFAVRRSKWRYSVDELKMAFDEKHHSVLDEAFPILASIFETSPELIEGAVEALQVISGLDGIAFALVTHSDEDWVDRKLSGTGLDNFFDAENTYVVDMREHKSSKHWLNVVQELSLKPHEVLVVGDSLPGDIRAAHEIGVKYKVWIPSGWSKYNFGEVPEGTYQIKSIGELIDLLHRELL